MRSCRPWRPCPCCPHLSIILLLSDVFVCFHANKRTAVSVSAFSLVRGVDASYDSRFAAARTSCSSHRLWESSLSAGANANRNANANANGIVSIVDDSYNNNDDSLEAFERDVTTVLKVQRKDEKDPTLPALFRKASLSYTWDEKDWKVHTSRWRYLRYSVFAYRSRLARRIVPQLCVILGWSALVCIMIASSNTTHVGYRAMQTFALPLTPLSLVSTFVAALLTMRSNQGLDRLNMGRLSFGKVVLYTRDTASLIVSVIYPKNPQLALFLLRHVSLFGWLLKGFLRGKDTNGNDHDILHTMLRGNEADIQYILSQRKPPMAIVMRLRQVLHEMGRSHSLNTAEELALDHAIQELNHCIMTTERIRVTPIPPLYTSHTGRLLLFYLFFLPLALRGSGMLSGWGTILTTFATAYAMLGLDEISFLLEQPFRLMPLFQLSKNSMMDVADAVVLRPPPLPTHPSSSWVEQQPSQSDPNPSTAITQRTSSPTYW